MLFYNEDKYDLDRFVVMPNHVHVIVQFRMGGSLSVVSQSWMRYTARQINAATSASGEFWQPAPFDHIIRSPEQFEYLQQYIFENPKKANLRKGEFLYGNANCRTVVPTVQRRKMNSWDNCSTNQHV